MGDANPIRTLGDYSKPSHEGYRNTIELPVGNNVVPLRSDTIRLVQNGCSFHGLRSEDPNQHLKDFLKLVDSLDLDGENRERTRLCLFQFSLRDQASNWLERLPAGSITIWEDLTTRFLAEFFPPGRTAKLRNDILIRTIDQSTGGKLRDRNTEESWALLEGLALYDNESWNDPRYFAKPVKAISLPQDVLSTSERRLIELENQVQRLMEAHLALTQPTQLNKITTSCEICSGPHDTQYCMEDPEQAFVKYASSQTNETGSRQFIMNQGPRNFNEAADTWKRKPNFNWAHAQTFTSPRNGSFSTYSSSYQTKLEKALIDFDTHQEKRLSSLRTQLEQQQDDMISKINLLWKAVFEKFDDAPIRDTAGNLAAQMNFTSTKTPQERSFEARESKAHQNETKEEGNVKTITTECEDHKMTVESEEEFGEETEDEIEEEEEDCPKHFDTFPTVKELRYHEWLLKNPRPLWVKAKVRTGNLNNVKFSCMIGHFDKKQAYLDMESPINVMSRLHYNWIMSKRLGPRRKPSNPEKICNFVGRVKGLKVFVGNFTYECDFMVLEDTTSIIDHDLGSIIFGKPFVKATGLVYDREEGTITFEKDKEKIVFKMPHKMEMFKHIDFTYIKTDHIPPFAIESDNDSSEKTNYSDSLDLGYEYKHDENVCRAIRSLIAMKAKRNKGEVT
ncbi:MAK10-like protein [Tanacetum coccineum]